MKPHSKFLAWIVVIIVGMVAVWWILSERKGAGNSTMVTTDKFTIAPPPVAVKKPDVSVPVRVDVVPNSTNSLHEAVRPGSTMSQSGHAALSPSSATTTAAAENGSPTAAGIASTKVPHGISVGVPPAGSGQAIYDAMKYYASQPTSRNIPPEYARPETLTVAPIAAFYKISSADITAGRRVGGPGLASAAPAGYLFAVSDADAPKFWSVVSLQTDGSAGPATVPVPLSSSSRFKAIVPVFDTLAGMDEIRAGSYELRVIENFAALSNDNVIWLKSNDNNSDLIYIVPRSATDTSTQVGGIIPLRKLMKADEFWSLLRPPSER